MDRELGMMLGESNDMEGSVSGLANWRRVKMAGGFDEPWVRPRGKSSESGDTDDEMVEPSVVRHRVEVRCWEHLDEIGSGWIVRVTDYL